jgi:hypothetical protein
MFRESWWEFGRTSTANTKSHNGWGDWREQKKDRDSISWVGDDEIRTGKEGRGGSNDELGDGIETEIGDSSEESMEEPRTSWQKELKFEILKSWKWKRKDGRGELTQSLRNWKQVR